MRRVVLGVLHRPKGGIYLLGAVCIVTAMTLPGCTSSAKLSDLGKPNDQIATASPDASSGDTTNTPGDVTGSIVTQPAEPGPSGEPVAPLAKPGFLGDDPNDDLQLGKKYFRNNSFGLAQKSFQSAIEKHPNDAEAWVGLAASYDRLRRFDLSDRAYAQAVRLVGPTPEILNNQGFSFMLRGDYQRAHKTLQQAEAKDPGNPYIQANLRLLEESYRDGKSVQ
ncbi:MAG TPA: tetratricopeptide repeat protein [Xanthobacteraceae bacterium]|nr:tetratricopeptide repeat protein [Xanthobacteraceae bacterium]